MCRACLRDIFCEVQVLLSCETLVHGWCGEGEDVVGVHTLLSGVVQVCHDLLDGEEEERKRNRDDRKREK